MSTVGLPLSALPPALPFNARWGPHNDAAEGDTTSSSSVEQGYVPSDLLYIPIAWYPEST
jgi:hypothetical protein